MRHNIFALGLLMILTTGSRAQRGELEILSYETGLTAQFLQDYFQAAQELRISATEAHSVVSRMTQEIKELRAGGRAYPRDVAAKLV